MNDCYDIDKIVAYIDNELSRFEKDKFENELKNNPELLKEYNAIKELIVTLKNLPKAETDSDFMVKLNTRIEEYEDTKSTKWYHSFTNIFQGVPQMRLGSKPNLTVGLSILSLAIVLTLAFLMTTSSDSSISPGNGNYLKSPAIIDSDNSENENPTADSLEEEEEESR